MVNTIIGYDKSGKKVFERDAREYDKSIGNTVLGLTIKEIWQGALIIVACTIFYINNENFKKSQTEFNAQLISSVSENAKAIGGMKEVMMNLNNYLSSTTGKQFKDGRPLTYYPNVNTNLAG